MKYDSVSESFSLSRKENWSEINFLFQEHLIPGSLVLDVGCGNGRHYELISPVAQYIGVDISKNLVEKARQSFPEGEFQTGNVLNLQFQSNFFDTVYGIALLHHIPSKKMRKKSLQEMHRVLKPKGKLVLTVWDIWEKPARRKEVIKCSLISFFRPSKLDFGDVFLDWHNEKVYFHCFSLKKFKKVVESSGFKVLSYGKAPSKVGTNFFVIAEKK